MGVTVLTSLSESDIRKLGIQMSLSQYVLTLAKIAYENNLDGIICSGREIFNIKKYIDINNFKILTPGIRLKGHSPHDQKYTLTPQLTKKYNVEIILLLEEL